MSQENDKPNTDTESSPVNIFAPAEPASLLASFIRTGFDGDVIAIYMRPERVILLKKIKLQMSFEVAEADASILAASGDAGSPGCDERKFDGLVAATGSLSLQQLAVLAEFIGKTLAAQGRKSSDVELELQVVSQSGDLEAANRQLEQLAKEVFAQ